MKVFILAALSADGFIARDRNELVDWTSKEDRKLFTELTTRAGVIVMGHNTYRTIGRALPNRRTIVYSSQPIKDEDVETTQEPPKKLVARLAKEGYKELAVIGGQSVYDEFLRAGVVDELYITVEPIVFGEGIRLTTLPVQLQLEEQRQLNQDVVLQHYRVKR